MLIVRLPGTRTRCTVQADESRNEVPSEGTVTTTLAIRSSLLNIFIYMDNGDCVAKVISSLGEFRRAVNSTSNPEPSRKSPAYCLLAHFDVWQMKAAAAATTV